MEKKLTLRIGFIMLLIFFGLFSTNNIKAETVANVLTNISEKYYVAEVVEIKYEEKIENEGPTNYLQMLVLKEVNNIGNVFEYENIMSQIDYEAFKVSVGDRIIMKELIDKETGESQLEYYEKYRSPSLQVVLIIFLTLVVFLARGKGVLSILGLVFSMLVVTQYMIPAISNGGDPFTVCLIATFIAGPISILLAHGWNKDTMVSVVSTMAVMFIAVLVSTLIVDYTQVFGIGDEDSYFLQVDKLGINIKGLFLGGIIVGILGILDDITTAQTAAVSELKKANSKFGFIELYNSALNIGKEHMASVVNTLILAYAGVSFPLLLLLTSTSNTVPFWVQLNQANLAEEIVRALSGSIVLVLAVPITTAIAAFFVTRKTFLDKLFKH